MMKRTINAALAVCLAVGLMPLPAFAGEGGPPANGAAAGSLRGAILEVSEADAFGGSGTQDDPFLIETAADLAGLAEQVNAGETFAGQCFALAADVDLAARGFTAWTPIGMANHAFKGAFDGRGHAVSGMAVDASTADAGLFGCVIAGSVRNVAVSGSVKSTSGAVGGVVGYASGATVEGCSFTGTVSGAFNVGGIAGVAADGTVSRCSFSGGVTASASNNGAGAGGIAGENMGTVSGCSVAAGSTVAGADNVGGIVGYFPRGAVEGCWNGGSVTTAKTGTAYAGGIAGRARAYVATTNGTSIERCGNAGAVAASGSCVGGVVGITTGTVANCYNTGPVSGSFNVGGVVGYLQGQDYSVASCFDTGVTSASPANQLAGAIVGNEDRSTTNGLTPAARIARCYYLEGAASMGDYATGGDAYVPVDQIKVLSAEDFAQESSFAGWDFSNVWVMSTDGSRPELRAALAARGEFDEIVYAWAEDGSSVTATPVVAGRADASLAETAAVVVATTEPTCTEAGATTSTADFSTLGYVTQVRTVAIPALGHSWDEGAVTREPTESAEGERTYTCARCGETRVEAIQKLESPDDGTGGEGGAGTGTDDGAGTGTDDGAGTGGTSGSDTSGSASLLHSAPATAAGQLGADGTAFGKGASTSALLAAIAAMKSDADPAGTVFGELKARAGKVKSKSVQLKWSKVAGAAGYMVFANRCGASKKLALQQTVTGTKLTFKKVAGAKLKAGAYYKFLVVAVDAQGLVVSSSKIVHAATKGGKVTNPKKVTTAAKKNKVKLAKAGKKFKLRATAEKQQPSLKLKKHRKVSFESSDPSVATVTKKGVVKAVAKGACYVYAYAQNGAYKRVKVIVAR